MRILLDIDDTAIISKDRGKTYSEHPLLRELLSNHEVILFSGNPDIEDYSSKWKTRGYVPKMIDYCPRADVLIDNEYEVWKDSVNVKHCFSSIDEFYKFIKKQK